MRTKQPGKTVEIYIKPQTALFGIRFKEGGELPAELQSLFTSSTLAKRAVSIWEQRRYGKITEKA